MKLSFQTSYNSWTIWIIYIICLVLIFISFTFNDVNSSIAAPLIIAMVVIMLLIPLRIYGRANKKYKKSPTAGDESFWKIDENGIEITSSLSNSQIKWDAVIKITQNSQWVFIWYSNSQYSYIPKNAITEPELIEIKKLFYANRKNRG